jgi:hypothetical protein
MGWFYKNISGNIFRAFAEKRATVTDDAPNNRGTLLSESPNFVELPYVSALQFPNDTHNFAVYTDSLKKLQPVKLLWAQMVSRRFYFNEIILPLLIPDQ